MKQVLRIAICLAFLRTTGTLPAQAPRHYLYVATSGANAPGGSRGIAILVFDIDAGHRLVKRMPLWTSREGDDEEVRGLEGSTRMGRLVISTSRRLAAIDVAAGRVLWQQSYEDHCCDRAALSPDGRTIYAASFGSAKWFVVNAGDGKLLATIPVEGWPRHTRYSRDGRRAFLAPWESPVLLIADTATHRIAKSVGPFSGFLCPFTVNATDTLVFANVDGLVGFEVGDLQTGLILDSVAVEGYEKDAASTYECPSHGIALTHNGRQLWVADGVRNRVHVFNAEVYPPSPLAAIDLSAQPRWVSFSADDRYAYPSTGDVIDIATRTIVGTLKDGLGATVTSEYSAQIDTP